MFAIQPLTLNLLIGIARSDMLRYLIRLCQVLLRCTQIIKTLITSCDQMYSVVDNFRKTKIYKDILRLSRCLQLLVVIRPDVLRPNDQLVDPEVYRVE